LLKIIGDGQDADHDPLDCDACALRMPDGRQLQV
jgi:hypothetical protein